MLDQLNHSLKKRNLKEITEVSYETTFDKWFEHLLKGIPTAYVEKITSSLADLNREVQAVADRIIELELIILHLQSKRSEEQSTYKSDIADASMQKRHDKQHNELLEKLSRCKKPS